MPEQHFNVSHGIKVGINTIHDNVVFDPVPDTDSKYTSSAIDVSANKKAIRLTGSGATTGNQDVTFAGGNAVTLTRSGNEISIASTDTDTTYTTSVVDGTSNKKIIRLTAGGAGSGDDDITLVGGTNVTLTRSGDEISFISTDTTYNVSATDTGSADKKNIVLTDSSSGVSTVTIQAGNNISVSRTANTISIASTYTDSNTDTTYSVSAADGGTAAKKVIRLTAGGAGSGTDDVTLVAGTNISLTRSSDEITITGANEADTLTSVTDRGAATTNDLTVASLTATGNINCAGTITYEDVTSVDSVGIITARQGLNVTGNVTVTGTVDGRDVASDGTKLDGIASGAEVNVKSDWNSTTGDNEILNKPTNVSAFTNDAGYLTTAFVAGMIMLWSGSSGSIPAGWALCDGGGGRPDLRNRFVIGAGSGYNVDATGGSTDAVVVEHDHGAGNYATNNTGSHTHGAGTLITNNTGSHTHGYNTRTLTSVHSYGDSNQSRPSNSTTSTNTGNAGSHSHNVTGNTGSGGSHAHNISGNSNQSGVSGAGKNMPPWYALCYIIKT